MAETPSESGRDDAPRRGVLDPIMSNRDGLFSALEERGSRTRAPGQAWDHRRGEPRLLVLCWAIYLLAASGATIMRLPDMGFADPRFVQTAARVLIVLMGVGLIVLWPMVRLSQASPRRPVVAALVDLTALLLPLTAVLWPVTWLGRWRWEVTCGLLAMLAAWGVVIAAITAMGTRRESSASRTLWAILLVLAIAGGPAIAAGLAGMSETGWALYASPLTGVYALTTEASALAPVMTPNEWWAALGPLCAGCVLWAVAAIGRSPRRA